MTFTEEQAAALQRPLPPDEIRTREAPDGTLLRYVTVAYVQRQMNEIFGPGGWQARALPAEYVTIAGSPGRVLVGTLL